MVYTVLKASLLVGLLENEHTIYMSGLSSGTLSFRKARNHPNSSFYLTVLLFKHDSLFLTLLCHTQTISQIFCGDLCQCEGPTAFENNGKSGETIPNHKVLKQNCSGEAIQSYRSAVNAEERSPCSLQDHSRHFWELFSGI